MRYTVPRGRLASVFVAAVLTGCATAPADRGLSEVQGLLKARDPTLASAQTALSADPESIDTQMATLMAAPLTADRALGVALLPSRVRSPDALDSSAENDRTGLDKRLASSQSACARPSCA